MTVLALLAVRVARGADPGHARLLLVPCYQERRRALLTPDMHRVLVVDTLLLIVVRGGFLSLVVTHILIRYFGNIVSDFRLHGFRLVSDTALIERRLSHCSNYRMIIVLLVLLDLGKRLIFLIASRLKTIKLPMHIFILMSMMVMMILPLLLDRLIAYVRQFSALIFFIVPLARLSTVLLAPVD